jgi:hypothetical protein
MALGLLLLIGAVGPYVVRKIADNIQSKSSNATEQAWQSSPPAPVADLAPAWKPPTAQPPSSAQSSLNMAQSTVPGSPQLLTSTYSAPTEKDIATSKPQFTASNAGNMDRLDNNNIVQPNATTTLAASHTNEILAADINAAAGKGYGNIPLQQSGRPDLVEAASVQSSPWPRKADDQADFSPWPNPAHPVIAKADPHNNMELPTGTESLSTRANSLPVIVNRPMVIGGAQAGKMSNPAGYRQTEQSIYPAGAIPDLRRNESVTADRRNAQSPGGAVPMPSVPPLSAPGTAQPSSENEAGTAQFEGTINTPSDRNTYDHSRQSIH